MLINNRADVTAQQCGATSLHQAAKQGNVKATVLLTEAGADPNKASGDFAGTTALILAVDYIAKRRPGRKPAEKVADDANDKRFLTTLLEAKANVNFVDADGAFPLIIAAEGEQGTEEIVELLLAAKADPSTARPADGAFSLFQAAQDGYNDRVWALLNADADPFQKLKDGSMDALQIAQEQGQSTAADILKTAQMYKRKQRSKVDV